MISDKSELFVSWHMIIKEDLTLTLRSLDSLQGLYDECIISVEDEESQDELYECIKIYPNTYVYKKKLLDEHFGNARNDVLSRVSKRATYIGWSDADEELVSPSPRKIREFLFEERPAAVNVILNYLTKLGPCLPGDHYRVKIWKADEPRLWQDAVHEYPAYKGTTGNPYAVNNFDIVFNHLKSGEGRHSSDRNIRSMLKDLDAGGTWRLPRISGEFRGIGKLEEAIEFAKQGLCVERMDVMSDSMSELEMACDDLGDRWNHMKFHLLDVIDANVELRDSSFVLEYLALSYYYIGDKELARETHEKAKRFDPDHELEFIWRNDPFFVQ